MLFIKDLFSFPADILLKPFTAPRMADTPADFVVLRKQPTPAIEFLRPEEFNTTADQCLNDALRGAEAHRRVRHLLHAHLRPGVALHDIVTLVEDATRTLLKGEKNNGIGFPCGVSLNNCAAHYTCNPGDKPIVLGASDVLKIDFGTHSRGRIMDSAFTVCFDPHYEALLRASQEATARGLKVIGIDAAVCEIGRDINEVFSGFEVEVDGRMVPVRPVHNLHGHSIQQYKIHGGVSIPPTNNGDRTRITGGFCAIETFASTGRAEVHESGDCSHYMQAARPVSSRLYSAKTEKVLNTIKEQFGTLPFSPRHTEFYEPGALTSIRLLALRGFLDPYPPLYDVPGSMIAQFEHTVYLTENSKQVLTVGDDY